MSLCRKGTAGALAVLMLLMFGCGPKSESSTPGDTSSAGSAAGESSAVVSQSTEEIKQGLPEADLSGYEFTIVTVDPSYLVQETDDITDYNQAVMKKMATIEETYGCKITVESAAPDTLFQNAQAAIRSGQKYADIIIGTQWQFGNFVAANLLQSFSDVPNIDLTQDIWTPEIVESTTFHGKTYGVGLTPMALDRFVFGVFFNKKILQEIGSSDAELYQMVDEGKWTLDTFVELGKKAKRDLNGDGKFDSSDRYGYMGPNYEVTVGLLEASGMRGLTVNDDGEITYGFNRPDAGEIVNRIKKFLYIDDIGYTLAADEDWTKTLEYFASDRSLFYLYAAGFPASYDIIADMETDFGYIPMPKFKETDEGYKCMVDHNMSFAMLPKTTTDLDKVGYVLNALALLGNGDEASAFYESYQLRYFRDDKSLEYFKNGTENAVVDLMFGLRQGYPNTDPLNNVYLPVVNTRTEEFSSYYSSTKTMIETALKELNDSLR